MKNRRHFIQFSFIVTTLLLVISGCKTTTFLAPSGFAAYKGEHPFRAVSPEGVMFRIRTEKNEPVAELSFWKTALKKHMTDSGYRYISENDVVSGNLKGYCLELSAPSGDKDFIYLITVFVEGDSLIIAEASGEVTLFKKRQPDIIEAFNQIGSSTSP